jgi:hypothetical protein
MFLEELKSRDVIDMGSFDKMYLFKTVTAIKLVWNKQILKDIGAQ